MRSTIIFVAGLLAAGAAATTVVVQNTAPRTDSEGLWMDIHDGNTFLHEDGLYYYYGAQYGNCTEPAGPTGCAGAATGACGFQLNHNVSLYTSPDLQTWTFHGHVFQMAGSGITGIMFCPKVLFNSATSTWVMWMNWIEASSFSDSYYAVMTSSSPYGPFQVVNPNVTLASANMGDFNLFKDDDGTAYIIYTSRITAPSPNHQMSVERLSNTYLSSTLTNSGFFGASFVEAPAMFKNGNTYWAVFGSCCCYCNDASPVVAYSSASPLGPYTSAGPLYPPNTIVAQQTNIFPFVAADGSTQFLWEGDAWQTSPNQMKGFDLSTWAVLPFSANGTIGTMQFLTNFTISVQVQPQ